jgi:hypothetical protein
MVENREAGVPFIEWRVGGQFGEMRPLKLSVSGSPSGSDTGEGEGDRVSVLEEERRSWSDSASQCRRHCAGVRERSGEGGGMWLSLFGSRKEKTIGRMAARPSWVETCWWASKA